MVDEEKKSLNELIVKAEANCKPLRTRNISTLFEEYWNRFTNLNQTELQNVEVRLIKQYIQKTKTEYLEALLDTLKSQIELSERQNKEEATIARRRYESLRDIITYK